MNFNCAHCGKAFKYEIAFMRHQCDRMIRAAEIRSITGQKSYELYCYWLKKQNRSPPGIETFTTSMYYSAFIKFFNYCKSTGIIDYYKYIDLMLKSGISPPVWRHADSYSLYLEHVDRKSTPWEQVKISVDTVLYIGEELQIDTSEIFQHLQFSDVLALLNDRKLSPWLLLSSTKFKQWMLVQTQTEHTQLKRLINFEYWIGKFNKHTEVVKEIRNVTTALGL